MSTEWGQLAPRWPVRKHTVAQVRFPPKECSVWNHMGRSSHCQDLDLAPQANITKVYGGQEASNSLPWLLSLSGALVFIIIRSQTQPSRGCGTLSIDSPNLSLDRRQVVFCDWPDKRSNRPQRVRIGRINIARGTILRARMKNPQIMTFWTSWKNLREAEFLTILGARPESEKYLVLLLFQNWFPSRLL